MYKEVAGGWFFRVEGNRKRMCMFASEGANAVNMCLDLDVPSSG